MSVVRCGSFGLLRDRGMKTFEGGARDTLNDNTVNTLLLILLVREREEGINTLNSRHLAFL